jgi:hypothetical protein
VNASTSLKAHLPASDLPKKIQYLAIASTMNSQKTTRGLSKRSQMKLNAKSCLKDSSTMALIFGEFHFIPYTQIDLNIFILGQACRWRLRSKEKDEIKGNEKIQVQF